jgi:hypothetical protein
MKYIALAVVAFAAGAELGLSKDQASARRHALTPNPDRKGWYQVTGPVQLKAGEEFQFDGELPKGMAESLEAVKKARASKADADAEAKAKAEALAAAEKAVIAAAEALVAAGDDEAAKTQAQAALAAAEAQLADLRV